MTPNPFLLFRAAALFNALVAVAFFFAAPMVARLLGLSPEPAPAVYIRILAACVGLFGWGYWMIAADPVRLRPFVLQAAVGKLSVVAIILASVAMGEANLAVAGLGGGDLIFGLLFVLYLVRTRV